MTGKGWQRVSLSATGLMLVIDKPARGSRSIRGPKGGEISKIIFSALRFGLPAIAALVHRLDRDTSAVWCSAAHKALRKSSASCSSKARSQRPIGRWEGNPARDEGGASALGRRDRRSRLVDEGRSFGPPIAKHPGGFLGRSRPAGALGAWAPDRTTHHLRVHCACARLADPGGCHLWAWRGDGVAAACRAIMVPFTNIRTR